MPGEAASSALGESLPVSPRYHPRAARLRGAEVYLVSGPTSLIAPPGVTLRNVVSAQEMRDEVLEILASERKVKSNASADTTRQFLFMSAAVCDHRPKEISTSKIKRDKTKPYSLDFEPCPDILKEVCGKRKELEKSSNTILSIVGFALETAKTDEDLVKLATEKLTQKGADLIVGNTADSLGQDTNRVWLCDKHGKQEEVATADKQFIAGKIIQAAVAL